MKIVALETRRERTVLYEFSLMSIASAVWSS
jgi:hypothetical protein